MKRLRLKCPFAGYGYIVFIIIFTIASVLAFVIPGVTSPDFAFHGIILRIILIASAGSLVAHLWLYRTNHKERELVKNAEKIYWRGLTDAEENQAKLNSQPNYTGFIVAVVVIIGIFLGYSTVMDFVIHPVFLIIISVTAVIAFIYLLSEISKQRKWQSIDNTAKCAVFPVHHTYAVNTSSKFMKSYNYYHVIYTSEGKLIFKSRTTSFSSKPHKPDIKKIRIFEYKNMFTYAEY